MLIKRCFTFFVSLILFLGATPLYALDKDALQKVIETEKENAQKINTLTNEIDALADKKNLTDKDKPAIIKALKNILELENIDPSRDGVMSLSESYTQHTKLYQSVLKNFNKKDQKTLNELFKIMENLIKEGNG